MKSSSIALAAALGLAPSLFAADKSDTLLVGRAGPKVIGSALALEVVPRLDAVESREGRRIWRDTVYLPGASFVKAHFVGFDLRPGDSLRLRGADGRLVEELTLRGPKQAGNFWGLSAFGDTLEIELDFKSRYERAPFRVDQVIAGDPGVFDAIAGSGPESICAPEDFDDVVCHQGDAGKWANILASVGVMSVGGNPATGLWCSGSNVSPLNYVLTNWHCIPDASPCASSEFVFNFYRTTCGGATNSTWTSFRCDETVVQSPIGDCDATVTALDFSLNSVIGDPSSTFGFVRPDPVELTDGEAIYIVQHPDGRPHEIAHGSGSDVDVDTSNPSLSVIRYYDTLDTEGGSSGSPIFREADDKMVGLHHCGTCTDAGVGNRGMLMSDIFPLIESYLCTSSFSLASAGHDGLQEVAGNGDLVLDAGETWSFVPKVRNGSCSLGASNVEATFQVDAASAATVTLLDPTASFGAIPATQVGTASAPIEFQLSADFPCGGAVKIDIASVTATEGGPFGPADLVDAASGLEVFASVLDEDFAAGIPGTWTVVNGGSGGGAAATWTTANPGGRSLPLTAPFVIVDSDNAGQTAIQDEQLVTPVLDFTGQATVELRFDHSFKHYQTEYSDVDVRSTATGGVWTNVARYQTVDTSGPVLLDISAQAGNQPDAQIRFRYFNAQWEYWWAVDDVRLGASLGPQCHPWSIADLFSDDFEFGSTVRWDLETP